MDTDILELADDVLDCIYLRMYWDALSGQQNKFSGSGRQREGGFYWSQRNQAEGKRKKTFKAQRANLKTATCLSVKTVN